MGEVKKTENDTKVGTLGVLDLDRLREDPKMSATSIQRGEDTPLIRHKRQISTHQPHLEKVNQ